MNVSLDQFITLNCPETYIALYQQDLGHECASKRLAEIHYPKWIAAQYPMYAEQPVALTLEDCLALAKVWFTLGRTAEAIPALLVHGACESRWELPAVAGLLTAEFWESKQ